MSGFFKRIEKQSIFDCITFMSILILSLVYIDRNSEPRDYNYRPYYRGSLSRSAVYKYGKTMKYWQEEHDNVEDYAEYKEYCFSYGYEMSEYNDIKSKNN